MKKILISVSAIAIVAALAVAGTSALFSDQEKSTGNVFTAGSIDLKVDHLKQTYNGADCKTCSVKLSSGTSDLVIARNGNAIDPVKNAVLVTNPNSRWTADVGNSDAKWIWATDPTLAEDTYGTSYTFKKTFSWFGPFTGSALSFSVGSDNSVIVLFNGVEIGRNDGEFGYQIPITISFTPKQGENELKFIVTNWNQSHDPASNPGGLLYALTINGNCGDDYFKKNCQLWGPKDLVQGDHFFDFNDVKPGDFGSNVISLHVTNNDAYTCLYTNNGNDGGGHLSKYLNAVVWQDPDQDGVHDAGEVVLYNGLLKDEMTMPKYDLASGHTGYLGLAWCMGDMTASTGVGPITCSGVGDQDDAQGDTFTADVTAYAVQQRNNSNFTCGTLLTPPTAPHQ